ncbi:MAG: polysaccharide deacetylase family protein [Lachnospiraceae bacterium]|nr:polysaccharide deacetylase family protein [Lachnospiraceae bacterium]
MKLHSKYICGILSLLLLTAAVSGCQNFARSENTPPAAEAFSKIRSEEKKYSENELLAFDNTIQNWGQGVQFNSDNQPLSSLEFQEKYGSFQADFIGPQEKTIWLTFDEGYENGYTEKILNVLKEKNCPAVFFVTGQYAQENAALMEQMVADGHAIGNHSWAHPSGGMPSLTIEEQTADMDKLHQYVKEHYDYEMTLFRYPAGIFSEQSMAVTQSYGYRTLFWSFAYADWDPDKQPDAAQTLKKLCDRLHPGSIYLLHAVSSVNAEILGDFIDYARKEGYEFRIPDSL